LELLSQDLKSLLNKPGIIFHISQLLPGCCANFGTDFFLDNPLKHRDTAFAYKDRYLLLGNCSCIAYMDVGKVREQER
jgi:hypothetical protein